MSIEKKSTHMGENKTILKIAGDLFQNVNVKMKKSALTAVLNADGVLPAGTTVTKDGEYVDGTIITDDKAYGVTYRYVNFKYSNGTESVPVIIFGFIDEKALPKAPSAAAKAAMKMLLFM